MGSYLFIEESTHSFACGAHGNTSVSFLVWDLTAAHPVDLMAELPDIESIIGLGQTAIDAQPDAIDFATDENPAGSSTCAVVPGGTTAVRSNEEEARFHDTPIGPCGLGTTP